MTIGELLAMYETSYFEGRDFVPVDRIATPREQHRALAEYKANPQKALEQNVEQAREDVTETTARMRLAKQDGILDPDMYRAATPEEKRRWRDAVKILKGDFQRATSDLAHWREYLGLAIDGTLPMPKDRDFKGLARALAEQKSYPDDSRLPPEREDAAE